MTWCKHHVKLCLQCCQAPHDHCGYCLEQQLDSAGGGMCRTEVGKTVPEQHRAVSQACVLGSAGAPAGAGQP